MPVNRTKEQQHSIWPCRHAVSHVAASVGGRYDLNSPSAAGGRNLFFQLQSVGRDTTESLPFGFSQLCEICLIYSLWFTMLLVAQRRPFKSNRHKPTLSWSGFGAHPNRREETCHQLRSSICTDLML